MTVYAVRKTVKQKIRILLAEDNITNQKMAMKILENLGYLADVVANGREAVKALELVPYDLVFMDVQMPEMDGFQATARIRDETSLVRNHQIPVIAMTAHSLEGDRERCLDAGMDGYISKPVNAAALAEALEKHLVSMTSTSAALNKPGTAATEPVQIRRIQTVADGDEDFERELIDTYLSDMEQHLQRLESALHDQNLEVFKKELHTIKGSSASAGAIRMKEIASGMGQTSNHEESDPYRTGLAELKREFGKVRCYFENYVSSQRVSH